MCFKTFLNCKLKRFYFFFLKLDMQLEKSAQKSVAQIEEKENFLDNDKATAFTMFFRISPSLPQAP